MRSVFFLLLLSVFVLSSCKKEGTTASIEKPMVFLKAIDTTNYTNIGQQLGDLDNDTIHEKILVFDTGEEGDYGTKRVLLIYKRQQNNWKLWKNFENVVLPSEGGGMWGDPFESISIENQTIVVNHFGGSSPKWRYKHEFKLLQQDFYLVHVKVFFAAPCNYFEDFKYDLLKGKANYEKEMENCETEKSTFNKKEFTQKLDILPKMSSFQTGENSFTFPDSDITIYY